MDMTTTVMAAVAIVAGLLWMARRRSRMRNETF
jgi:hypothetical protein